MASKGKKSVAQINREIDEVLRRHRAVETSDRMSDEGPPVYRGFEYRVRLVVSIPLAWAEFLREVALHHYDHWCQESAKAGVVNALRNTACDSEHPSSYPVGWRDLDLLAKIMEQARYHAKSEEMWARVGRINAWIRQAKDWIIERSEALAKWDTEQIGSLPLEAT